MESQLRPWLENSELARIDELILAKPGDTIEVTRWGMQPQHMSLIARAIADRLLARRSTSSIRAEIEEFRMQFQQLHFVLDTVS